MLRTRSLQSPTKSSKIFPTCHGTHRSLQCPRYPSRNFGTCPEPTINRRCRKCFFKGCLLGRIKEGTPAIGFSFVSQCLFAIGVMVPAKFPNAVSSAANDVRNFARFLGFSVSARSQIACHRIRSRGHSHSRYLCLSASIEK